MKGRRKEDNGSEIDIKSKWVSVKAHAPWLMAYTLLIGGVVYFILKVLYPKGL